MQGSSAVGAEKIAAAHGEAASRRKQRSRPGIGKEHFSCAVDQQHAKTRRLKPLRRRVLVEVLEAQQVMDPDGIRKMRQRGFEGKRLRAA
jgi:hypothetical protein